MRHSRNYSAIRAIPAITAAVLAAGVTVTVAVTQGALKPASVPVASQRLVVTQDGMTATVTADHIALRKERRREYSLGGDFHVIGPTGWEYHGKDATLRVEESRIGTFLSLATHHRIKRLLPVSGSKVKRTTVHGTRGQRNPFMVAVRPKAVNLPPDAGKTPPLRITLETRQ